ncbi:MAG: hypothetical protein OXN89_24710, partial [Bryobacterales bacterium]|nr:hypothetical protein [Bryobacterales bacterium]
GCHTRGHVVKSRLWGMGRVRHITIPIGSSRPAVLEGIQIVTAAPSRGSASGLLTSVVPHGLERPF